MKTRGTLIVACVLLVLASGARGQDKFVPGHIYVAAVGGEECEPDMGNDVILEIDPVTGATSIFADLDDGLCRVSGLRFTPDGQRLLALSAGRIFPPTSQGWVQSFAPDGTSEVILDESDGLRRPFGANALAFDAAGDLYVLNSSNSTILRFPVVGGPATVFADSADGIFDRGALDFASNGDLFYCGDLSDAIIRITPDGESSVFDPLLNPLSLAFDSQGNLFVSAGLNVYRYDSADLISKRILADGFQAVAGSPLPLRLSPDGSVVYLADISRTVYKIDADDGTTTVLVNFSDLAPFLTPTGMTVYAPPPPPLPIPAVSEWGLVVIVLLMLIAGTLLLMRHPIPSTARSDVAPFFERETNP